MSLQGTLTELGLAEVLQTSLAGRRGRLVLTSGVLRSVLLIDPQGVRLLDPEPVGAEEILRAFVQRGWLRAPDVEDARSRTADPVAALDHLVATGRLDGELLEETLQTAAEDALLAVLTWDHGTFRLDDEAQGSPPLPLAGRVPIDPSGLLLRAAQRQDEQRAITDTLGPEPHLFLAMPGAQPPGDEEGIPTASVHALLDGRHVVAEIALLCGVGSFTALRALHACVLAGAARPATPGEIGPQAEVRMDRGDVDVARRLLLQWVVAAPHDPEPLRRLAELGALRRRPDETRDALLSLGGLCLEQHEPVEAGRVFEEILTRCPGDREALEGLRATARASGDLDRFRRVSIEAATIALERDDPEQAAEFLAPVVSGPDCPVAARHLRGRALVKLKDREALVADAEALRRELHGRCRSKEARAAAAFFRDAIAHLAPEHSDLLRAFRALGEGRARRTRRVALVAALLLAIGAAGVVLWPESPAHMLARAEQALEGGDPAGAMEILADLVDRHPDSAEAQRAWSMQAQLSQPPTPPTTAPTRTPMRKELEEAVTRLRAALAALPSADACAEVDAVARALNDGLAHARRDLFREVAEDIDRTIVQLSHDARRRADHLARSEYLIERDSIETEALRGYVTEARRYLGDGRAEELAAAANALRGLLATSSHDPTGQAVRKLDADVVGLRRAVQTRAGDVAACRRLLALRDVLALYESCRGDAAQHLVAGRLDEARARYDALARGLHTIEEDPELASLGVALEQRRIPAFLAERRALLQDVEDGLAAAAAAEAVGDVDTAVEAYAALATRHWQIRFDNVIRVPIRVESVPAGARVLLNGEVQGQTPVVVHRRWGTAVTLTVDAPGYAPATQLLGEDSRRTRSRVHVALQPTLVWTADADATLSAPATAIGPDVLVCDRSGRVVRHDGRTGRVLWARQVRSLEGVRDPCLVDGGVVYVPLVDGRVMLLDARDGEVTEEVKVGRPVAAGALLDGVVVFATLDGRAVGLRGRRKVFDVPTGQSPTTRVVAAHGAFWVGTADGVLVRVDPAGHVTTRRIAPGGTTLRGLVDHEDGLFVTTTGGTLHALDEGGAERWQAAGIGDALGDPARAGAIVGVVDHRGRVLLFDVDRGEPRGQIDLEGKPTGGLVGAAGLLVASVDRERLWVHDAEGDRRLADVVLGGRLALPPSDLGGGRLLVTVDGEHVALLRLDALRAE